MGFAVIGISSDSIESDSKSASKYHLPFDILSDVCGKIRALYEVPISMGLPGRLRQLTDKRLIREQRSGIGFFYLS